MSQLTVCARVYCEKRKKKTKEKGGREREQVLHLFYVHERSTNSYKKVRNESIDVLVHPPSEREDTPQILILLFLEALYSMLRWTCAAVCDALLLTATKTISFYFHTFVLSAVICVFRFVCSWLISLHHPFFLL